MGLCVFSLLTTGFVASASTQTDIEGDASSGATNGNQPLLVSITPFPYDNTPAAVQTVNRITQQYATLSTVQLDNGIPWQAALDGSPFDSQLMSQWKDRKAAAGSNPVYLAIAPLAEDRTSWAPAFGGNAAPQWATDQKHASAQLKRAYAQYVLRAVEYFQPEYLNIGMEAGDMAARDPGKWPLFETVFAECAKEVRTYQPALKLGISFSLPLLMEPGVLKKVEKVIEDSDYVGISFYPYLSSFYVKLGATPLPQPPRQWQKPLEWLDENVTKPVAICETGYASEPVALPNFGLWMDGSEPLQTDYVADLASFARKDHYLFTVFFLSVDCVPLMKKLPARDGSDVLWTHTGFMDENLREKPAWAAYKKTWLGIIHGPAGASGVTLEPVAGGPEVAVQANSGLAFRSSADLFAALPPDKVSLAQTGEASPWMCWQYTYKTNEFSWATRSVEPGSASGSLGLKFDIQSDRQYPLLLEVEQADGGAFFSFLHPGKVWTHEVIPWTEFWSDPTKPNRGKLNPDQIILLMLADGAAIDQKLDGQRTVEMAKLQYLSGATK